MRKKIIAGNWKMNLSVYDGVTLVKDVQKQFAESPENVEIVYLPPFTHINSLEFAISSVGHFLGAQNCGSHESGAYTGEVAASMLSPLHVKYVIVGHSERRTLFNEDHATLKLKVEIALRHNLQPIFCCGETLEQRDQRIHFDVVRKQLEESLLHLNQGQISNIVIAYEPVWAIGTGKTASPEQAQEMHLFIRGLIRERYGNSIAELIPILYGGSVKGSNAAELFAQSDIDGALVGGASIIASEFSAIIQAAKP